MRTWASVAAVTILSAGSSALGGTVSFTPTSQVLASGTPAVFTVGVASSGMSFSGVDVVFTLNAYVQPTFSFNSSPAWSAAFDYGDQGLVGAPGEDWVEAYLDGGATVGPSITLGTLTIPTAGLSPGTYPVIVDGSDGFSGVCDYSTYDFEPLAGNCSFTIAPSESGQITGALVQGQACTVTVSNTFSGPGYVMDMSADLSAIGGPSWQYIPRLDYNHWTWTGTVTPPSAGTKPVSFQAFVDMGPGPDGFPMFMQVPAGIATTTVDARPAVNAGADQAAVEGQGVHLHATASDPDGDPLTCAWTQPAGLNASLDGASTADASFTAPTVSTVAEGSMTFAATVSDGRGGLVSDSVNVRVYMQGDINQDDAVDVIDLLDLIAAFGSNAGDANYSAACDFNGDSAVDVIDLLTFVGSFGRTLQ